MGEDFIKKSEFDEFKRETEKRFDKMERELESDKELLNKIDKTTDSIAAKLSIKDKDDEKIINLKLAPIEADVKELQETNKWLKRTIAGTIIGVVIAVIVAGIKAFAI